MLISASGVPLSINNGGHLYGVRPDPTLRACPYCGAQAPYKRVQPGASKRWPLHLLTCYKTELRKAGWREVQWIDRWEAYRLAPIPNDTVSSPKAT